MDQQQDLRQSREYGKFMESMGWQVNKGMFVKKLPLVAYSFIKYQRPRWPVDFEKIEGVIKKYRAIQIKIELDERKNKKIEKEFLRQGYKKDKSAMLPTKTIWLDLRKSEKELLKAMKSKTRYNLRRYGEKVKIIRGDEVKNEELKGFYEIYKRNYKKQGFWGMSDEQLTNLLRCFGKKGYWLWVKDLGGLIILIHDKTVYYSHNAATKEGRKRFVPSILTWEGIKLGKKLGCLKFDFEGIVDERFAVTRKWRGFSRFKKGFGGNEVEYIGSFKKFNQEVLWERK